MYQKDVNEKLSVATYKFSNVITLVVIIITATGVFVLLIILRN